MTYGTSKLAFKRRRLFAGHFADARFCRGKRHVQTDNDVLRARWRPVIRLTAYQAARWAALCSDPIRRWPTDPSRVTLSGGDAFPTRLRMDLSASYSKTPPAIQWRP